MKDNKKISISSSPLKSKVKRKGNKNRNTSVSASESDVIDNSDEFEAASALEACVESELEENLENELSAVKQSKDPRKVNSRHVNSDQQNSSFVNLTFSLKDLTCDDEIYTLQCPQNFPRVNLLNKILDFSRLNPTITNKGEAFHLQLLDSNKKFITLAVPENESKGSLIRLPLKGHCILQKVIDLHEEPISEEDFENHSIKFPKDIKKRHPLLGIDWKAHFDLANAAIIKKNIFIVKEKIPKNDFKKSKRKNSDHEIISPKKKKKIV